MAKNKNVKKQLKSGNPIYKKAGSLPSKAKSKTKQVKTNLRQIKLDNKKAISSLDDKLSTFRQAVSDSHKPKQRPAKPAKPEPVDMDAAVEELAKL